MVSSQQWPYMIPYLAVDIPPRPDVTTTIPWNTAELTGWYLMDATTSALVQVSFSRTIILEISLNLRYKITHIQFLTLLYPSRLEGRLILCLLGTREHNLHFLLSC
jgi:hypothetical protein